MSKELNFEDTMTELETIVKELEKGEMNLDDSVNKFEKGIELSKKANDFLEKAEKKVTILINDDGELKEKNFE